MRHYFLSEEGGERSVCLAFGFLSLLVAMLVLVVREDYLEFGLESGFSSLFDNLEVFAKQQGYADWSYVPLRAPQETSHRELASGPFSP